MKYEIKNRWTGAVQFTAEIECSEDAQVGVKVGLSVKWAVAHDADLAGANLTGANLVRADLTGANLTGANLAGANLAGADLTGANLAGANLAGANLAGADLAGANLVRADLTGANLVRADLTGANLTGANLTGANLVRADLTGAEKRAYKSDIWMLLTENRHEAAGVLAALKAGAVDGSTYSGDCACLVGTIANLKHCNVETLPMDSSRPAEQWFMMIRPGDTPENSSAAKQAAEWIKEWCDLNGIAI